jgi:MFS family permease
VTTAARSLPGIRSRVPIPSLVGGTLAVLAVLLVVGLILTGIPAHQNELSNFSQEIATSPPLAVLGFLIVRQQPRNKTGWLMLVSAVGLPLTSIGAPYVVMIYRLGDRLPFGPVAMLIAYSWLVPTAALSVAILLFPDGRLPSPRWRWVLRTALAAATGLLGSTYGALLSAIADHNIRFDSTGGIAAADYPTGWFAVVSNICTALIAGCLLLFLVAQVLAWRRADNERRQQLKWLLVGAVAFLLSGIITLTVGVLDPRASAVVQGTLNAISAAGWVALPVGMGVAILRYRLYDIDRIISRTLAYAAVTAMLAALYAGLVLLATQVLDLTSQVAVAAATLAAAALFNPLRRRVQRAVDHRFNRARYNADNTVAAFAARLQDATDPAAVRSDLIGTVHHALEPAQVSLWRVGGAS